MFLTPKFYIDNIIFIFSQNSFTEERCFPFTCTAFQLVNQITLLVYRCIKETSPYESDPKFAIKKKKNLEKILNSRNEIFSLWRNKNTTWVDPENSVRGGRYW